jgi:hypothetical protein
MPRLAQIAIPKYQRDARTISTSTEPRKEDDQEDGYAEQEDFHSWTMFCLYPLFYIGEGTHLRAVSRVAGAVVREWSSAGCPILPHG